MKKYKYVDEFANVKESFDSSVMSKTDEIFLNENGIIEVSKDRWNEAQRYERSEWMNRGLNLKDDRNYYHLKLFDNYSSLNDINIESMIELGCGPFTNARIISDVINVKNVTLLDPLLLNYVNHPWCTYRDGKLNGKLITVVNSSIEEYNSFEQFDLVVMINVLEHCQSIPKVFENITKMLKDDGHFIFSDVYFDYETIKDISSTAYNAGHPIRIEKKYLFNFLEKFDVQYSSVVNETVAGRAAHEIYFIGRKKRDNT